MKKLLALGVLCVLFLCGCSNSNSYLNELPNNLKFDMSVSEVKSMYGESQYTIKETMIDYYSENDLVSLMYDYNYLDLQCILCLYFDNDELSKIRYEFYPSISNNEYDDFQYVNIISNSLNDKYGASSTVNNQMSVDYDRIRHYSEEWKTKGCDMYLFALPNSEIKEFLLDFDKNICVTYVSFTKKDYIEPILKNSAQSG